MSGHEFVSMGFLDFIYCRGRESRGLVGRFGAVDR